MKKFLFKAVILICSALFIVSCTNPSGQVMKKGATGKPGEMIVVISKESWESSPGNLIRETLGQPQLALPQEEPLFNLIDVPHEAFTDIFKSTGNIVITKISPTAEETGIAFQNDVWARPQATVKISAKNSEEFNDLFTENSDKILAYFLHAEKKRLMDSYKKIPEKAVLNTLQKHGISMYVKPGFIIAKEKDDFFWFRYETPEISQGIFVYWFDYTSDSIFTSDFLVAKRDSLLRKYVPGPLEGGFMTTETRVPQVFNIFEHNGNYAAEMRGLWKVENDFMGGPYILLAELDASSQRVVVADGYVYAPSKNKRNLLREVEAMIYSLKFKDQKKNDKINSQVKMGN
ncbi:hypothetical protein MNBD_BACTEROID01-403 [hydrothermal vent metagenome]|uniref:DUF4837 domain-containing protein n=1 Tax=hydrothermal vent metagenome TaxID=652676 RepID=A0A3B0TBV5_9ZZZZ